jgi:hypothetical protein
MKLYALDIELTLKAPFNTAASEPARLGLDAPLLRDHRNRICLPGTLVQGRLAEELANWGDIAGSNPLASLLSQVGQAADSAYVPKRKQIVFSDFVAEPCLTSTFVRIAIDEHTGSVKPGALQTIEQAGRPGESITFNGYALTWCSDAGAAQKLSEDLTGALRLIPNFGADRSVGYGRLVGVKATACKSVSPKQTIRWPDGANAVALSLTFDRPIVVTAFSPNTNLFEGQSTIPGNVLKGAFADTCRALGRALPPAFDDIVFRHALCAAQPSIRPRAQPQSLVRFHETVAAVDVALTQGALVATLPADQKPCAPQYAGDWKESDVPLAELNPKKTLAAHFGAASPDTRTRVRTAIESETRAAKESALFAYAQVLPEYSEESSDGTAPQWVAHTWHAAIDVSAIADTDVRKQAITAIEDVLQHGLFPISKTKAHARIGGLTRYDTSEQLSRRSVKAGDVLTLTLQTPACLLRVEDLQTAKTPEGLRSAYNKVFAALNDGALELSHFHASQTLRGGHYQRTRFQKEAYQPWVLTEAGSVFVFKVIDAIKATEAVTQWVSRGLPIPPSWGAAYSDWQRNPYLPQNGFGEVRCNEPEHWAWQPSARKLTVSETAQGLPS